MSAVANPMSFHLVRCDGCGHVTACRDHGYEWLCGMCWARTEEGWATMNDMPAGQATATDAITEAIADLEQRTARIERVLARHIEWHETAESAENTETKP